VDDKIENKMSGYFRQAFGNDLIVHRNAGNQVPLHCGDRPKPKEGEDRVSIGYISELEKLPALRANSLFEGQLSTINEGSMQAARGGRF
jgi:hypothetical protein